MPEGTWPPTPRRGMPRRASWLLICGSSSASRSGVCWGKFETVLREARNDKIAGRPAQRFLEVSRRSVYKTYEVPGNFGVETGRIGVWAN